MNYFIPQKKEKIIEKMIAFSSSKKEKIAEIQKKLLKDVFFLDSKLLLFDEENILLLVKDINYFTFVYDLQNQQIIKEIFGKEKTIFLTDFYNREKTLIVELQKNINDIENEIEKSVDFLNKKYDK